MPIGTNVLAEHGLSASPLFRALVGREVGERTVKISEPEAQILGSVWRCCERNLAKLAHEDLIHVATTLIAELLGA